MFNPRPGQREILNYTHGWMAVSAVPGSGKTHALSALAARLIAENHIDDNQEILIVTLVNSAVENFASRLEAALIQEAQTRRLNIPSDFGYRVCTLHSLARTILRERPDLAGLPNNFEIVDESIATEIIKNATGAWLRTHEDIVASLTSPEIDLAQNSKIRREWPDLAASLAKNFIRKSKDLQQTPEELSERLRQLNYSNPLLEMGLEVYAGYQRALNYRSALDFDDLVRLALRALQSDPGFVERLHLRWPYILEDEAQDSSQLQESILRLLAGENGNWVRVGDPNQAVYETFTTASPKHLREFMTIPGVIKKELPESGRSTLSIIKLANELILWTREDHPNPDLREALTLPIIQPTQPGDPQPNPAANPKGVILYDRPFQPEEEIKAIVRSLKNYLPEHKNETIAVLVPRNKPGSEVVEKLKEEGLPYFELLQNSVTTQKTARVLAALLKSLSEPSSASHLAAAYKEIGSQAGWEAEAMHKTIDLLRKCQRLEEYIWPLPDHDWIANLIHNAVPAPTVQALQEFRAFIQKWQNSTLLPIDQLILTIAQDIFVEPPDLALSHQIALMLEQKGRDHPAWGLPEFAEELDGIATNQRHFANFSDGKSNFDPQDHIGQVVVSTIHKAKGLEWDRVYLLSANNYDFPSGELGDNFIAEKYYIRGRLNLEAETLARLEALAAGDLPGLRIEEGVATLSARQEYARERLRLFFVGITRARRDLIISWNTGQRNDCTRAVAFDHLRRFWEEAQHEVEA